MFRVVIVIGLLGGANIAMAEQVRMTGEDIKRVMQPGAVLAIDTPLRISIPVTVAHGGIVSAEAGALGLTLGALKDRGRWWTDGDQLCMKWFRWFDAKVRCMVLHRDGNKVQWAEGSGENGTATITEARPVVAAAAPSTAKKEKRVVTAALVEPVAAPSEDSAPPPPATEAAATPAPAETPAASETPATSDTVPALQFAAAALAKAMKPAPLTPSKLGMGETAPGEAVPAPVDVEPAAEAVPAPPPRVEDYAEPKAKPAPVAVRSPAARKSTADAAKPVQVSFRVSGVIDGDTLNVRSGPSEYHPAVGRIPASGRGVQIVGACRELWCPIRHGRLKGWVNRYYLAEDVSLRR